ncbi:hypothetical protein GCM10022224_002730 [Nonomuraea antimicrobica]|uniref:Uncharacterized protein n=1 Tax=Nonomuraea antimicrobica TaxID=561173 RepID=A0ABP7AZJ5_9ACTN
MVVKPAEGAHGRRITLPVVGALSLPEPRHLAFYAVLVSLGVLEIVEWPVVGVIAIGHALASQRRFVILQEAGEAAESA